MTSGRASFSKALLNFMISVCFSNKTNFRLTKINYTFRLEDSQSLSLHKANETFELQFISLHNYFLFIFTCIIRLFQGYTLAIQICFFYRLNVYLLVPIHRYLFCTLDVVLILSSYSCSYVLFC